MKLIHKGQRLVTFLFVTLTSFASSSAETLPTDHDWVFRRHLELYVYLLRSQEVAEPLRAKFQEGFHRFSFEYWLLSETNRNVRSRGRRGHVREMLHREAKNDQYFSDPALLRSFFKHGKLVPSFGITPITGLAMTDLTEAQYSAIVSRFQAAFFDLSRAFPADPVPTASAVVTGETDDHVALRQSIDNRRWRLVTRDKFPARFESDAFRVFALMAPEGKAYYLPAFLRMCEREPELVADLPKQLVAELGNDSQPSKELRSKFSLYQKECIVAFFEEWSKDGASIDDAVKKLRTEFGL